MTDFIALAKQAGLMPYNVAKNHKALQAFADLIKKEEREACAVECEKQDAHAAIWDCAAAIRARTTT